MIHENSKKAAQNVIEQYWHCLKAEGQEIRMTETAGLVELSAIDPLYGHVFVK